MANKIITISREFINRPPLPNSLLIVIILIKSEKKSLRSWE